MIVIKFDRVDFSYGNQALFDQLSFHLKHGQYLVLSGPARSGKSTMVQMIAGMIVPDAGEIIVEGFDLRETVKSRKNLRELRRRIGGVGGIYSLLTDRTILENVALSAEISGIPSRTARKNALEACSKYHLGHVASHFPDMVSEVERRAALLARAEAGRKDLIVADTPTDGLDEDSAGYIHDRLAALRLAGISILYLTSGPGPQHGPDEYLHFKEGKLTP
jgi:putative ABC transport system ATP-binding protein